MKAFLDQQATWQHSRLTSKDARDCADGDGADTDGDSPLVKQNV